MSNPNSNISFVTPIGIRPVGPAPVDTSKLEAMIGVQNVDMADAIRQEEEAKKRRRKRTITGIAVVGILIIIAIFVFRKK